MKSVMKKTKITGPILILLAFFSLNVIAIEKEGPDINMHIPRIPATQSIGRLPLSPRERCHPIHRIRLEWVAALARGIRTSTKEIRSFWIPWSYAPTLFEKRHAFLRPLKKKGFQ